MLCVRLRFDAPVQVVISSPSTTSCHVDSVQPIGKVDIIEASSSKTFSAPPPPPTFIDVEKVEEPEVAQPPPSPPVPSSPPPTIPTVCLPMEQVVSYMFGQLFNAHSYGITPSLVMPQILPDGLTSDRKAADMIHSLVVPWMFRMGAVITERGTMDPNDAALHLCGITPRWGTFYDRLYQRTSPNCLHCRDNANARIAHVHTCRYEEQPFAPATDDGNDVVANTVWPDRVYKQWFVGHCKTCLLQHFMSGVISHLMILRNPTRNTNHRMARHPLLEFRHPSSGERLCPLCVIVFTSEVKPRPGATSPPMLYSPEQIYAALTSGGGVASSTPRPPQLAAAAPPSPKKKKQQQKPKKPVDTTPMESVPRGRGRGRSRGRGRGATARPPPSDAVKSARGRGRGRGGRGRGRGRGGKAAATSDPLNIFDGLDETTRVLAMALFDEISDPLDGLLEKVPTPPPTTDLFVVPQPRRVLSTSSSSVLSPSGSPTSSTAVHNNFSPTCVVQEENYTTTVRVGPSLSMSSPAIINTSTEQQQSPFVKRRLSATASTSSATRVKVTQQK